MASRIVSVIKDDTFLCSGETRDGNSKILQREFEGGGLRGKGEKKKWCQNRTFSFFESTGGDVSYCVTVGNCLFDD